MNTSSDLAKKFNLVNDKIDKTSIDLIEDERNLILLDFVKKLSKKGVSDDKIKYFLEVVDITHQNILKKIGYFIDKNSDVFDENNSIQNMINGMELDYSELKKELREKLKGILCK